MATVDDFMKQLRQGWCGAMVLVDGHALPCVLAEDHTIDHEHDPRRLREHLALGPNECRKNRCLTTGAGATPNRKG